VQFELSTAEMDGDPTRLLQEFLNLLSNAIKFTTSGGNVRVKLVSIGDCHTTSVSDTGEGISAEFLPFVFDRYRQADGTAGRRGGLGLGLTIARHIVELHGGTIKAESGKRGRIGIHHSTSAQRHLSNAQGLMALGFYHRVDKLRKGRM